MQIDSSNLNKVDFDKMNNLVPTIVQDESGQVISLVYSSKESLKLSIESGFVWKESRARGKPCKKGATSGNTQSILYITSDCDNDALLMKVRQNGSGGCHTGSYSCFEENKNFDLNALYDKVLSRKENASPESYTRKLFENEELLKKKLVEEAAEVILAKTKENLIWECSDLIYFLFAIMVKNGVNITDVENENKRRDNKTVKREVMK